MTTSEATEVNELNAMFATGQGKSNRDSNVTAARYNKWLTGEQNRQ